MLRSFSETISTGADFTGVDSTPDSIGINLTEPTPIFYSDVTVNQLQQGKDLDEKVKIYFDQAGIIEDNRKKWIEYKLDSLWKDEKYLQLQGPKSSAYNKELLNFLEFHDNDYRLSRILEGKEPIPKELQKHLKAQIDELVKKPVKARGKEQIALSAKEQEKIYASPGVVPTWWWHDPKKDTYTYHASKAIKTLNVSARDVRLTVEKAAKGEILNPHETQIIVRGWGILGGIKLLDGKYPVSEKTFRLYGEYYHRDVGWY